MPAFFLIAIIAGMTQPNAAVAASGTLCIAPFHAEEPSSAQPPRATENMSQTTWRPSSRSVFEFRVDDQVRATVQNHQMATIDALPLDRKVKVAVRLDNRPFETFWLNLKEKPQNRICLWLYPGYWHWIDNGWQPASGCSCSRQRVSADL